MQNLLELASMHREALMWTSVGSAAMFFGSLLLVPWLVARAPHDFFVRERGACRGPLALLLKFLRNVLGVALLLTGIVLLFLPGQGLLLVLLALSMLDVPGKRTLVRRIVQRPPVWRALSYLRERADVPPFERP